MTLRHIMRLKFWTMNGDKIKTNFLLFRKSPADNIQQKDKRTGRYDDGKVEKKTVMRLENIFDIKTCVMCIHLPAIMYGSWGLIRYGVVAVVPGGANVAAAAAPGVAVGADAAAASPAAAAANCCCCCRWNCCCCCCCWISCSCWAATAAAAAGFAAAAAAAAAACCAWWLRNSC